MLILSFYDSIYYSYVTWTIVVAAISTHDYQQSWLSRPLLNTTSFVFN